MCARPGDLAGQDSRLLVPETLALFLRAPPKKLSSLRIQHTQEKMGVLNLTELDERSGNMAADGVIVYLGVYGSVEDAKEDFADFKEAYKDGFIGLYDAGILEKRADGKVHLDKWEKPTQVGAIAGATVGVVVGLLFPPALITEAVVAGAAGGLIGHFWKGMSRKDVKELGEELDAGEAALIFVGESKVEEEMEKIFKKAEKQVAKELDIKTKDLDAALEEAAAE
jgi:uncharacterized membrane protein